MNVTGGKDEKDLLILKIVQNEFFFVIIVRIIIIIIIPIFCDKEGRKKKIRRAE